MADRQVRRSVGVLLAAIALAWSLSACVPPPPHVPAVKITTPAAGATVTSPMRVAGTAQVFEGVFFLEVSDGVGTVLSTERLMASGAFDETISFQAPPGPLTLIAYTLSAKDGSRVEETRVSIVAG